MTQTPVRTGPLAEHPRVAVDRGGPLTSRRQLAGRESELARIAAALDAARAGRGGAFFVRGEPGMGRTRLAVEAVAMAGPDMATGMGRTSTVGPLVRYRSLAEALHSLTRTGPPLDHAELGHHGPVLAGLLAGVPHAAASPVVVAEAVLRLLAVVGRGRGVLLVLDDLHDADPGTLAVVEYLLGHVAQQPVVLLLTARRETCVAAELATRARQHGLAVVLDLLPLTAVAVRELLATARGARPIEIAEALVRRVCAHSGGIPFVVTELLDQPTDDDYLAPTVPAPVAEDIRRRVARLAPLCAEFLSAAALFGPRFPLSVPHRAVGCDDAQLCVAVRALVAAYLIVPEEGNPGWYAFRHPLAAEVPLTGLVTVDRTGRARRIADTVTELGKLGELAPDTWRVRAAELYEQAGHTGQAVGSYCAEADRVLAEGEADRALSLLLRANRLAGPAGAAAPRGRALECLLEAVAHTARLAPVAALISGEETPSKDLSAACRVRLQARLVDLALLTARPATAARHLELAHWSLPNDPADAESAVVDLAAAHLEPHRLGATRLRTAWELAHRALAAARRADLPAVACRAALLLAQLAGEREDSDVRQHLTTAHALARAHCLPVLRVTAEARMALVDADRDGSLAGVDQAYREARRLAAPALAQEIGLMLAREEVRRCEFAAAGERIRALAREAERLGLVKALAHLDLAEATRLAHQGRRAEMEKSLDRLADIAPELRAMAYGQARAYCSLLAERRQDAERELAQALVHDTENPAVGDFGRYGLALLLGVLAGRLGRRHHADHAGVHAAGTRWNRVFAESAEAVLLGREGRTAEASAVADTAVAAAPYPMARALCARLVSEEAYLHGWGAPVEWLRDAEEYFHGAGLRTVAGACRARLRGMGASVRQRRKGVEQVPAVLRRVGVTAREFEVAELLVERISNKDIAAVLYISPRTVEKHVTSLLQKTGHPHRAAFACALRALFVGTESGTPVHG